MGASKSPVRSNMVQETVIYHTAVCNDSSSYRVISPNKMDDGRGAKGRTGNTPGRKGHLTGDRKGRDEARPQALGCHALTQERPSAHAEGKPLKGLRWDNTWLTEPFQCFTFSFIKNTYARKCIFKNFWIIHKNCKFPGIPFLKWLRRKQWYSVPSGESGFSLSSTTVSKKTKQQKSVYV